MNNDLPEQKYQAVLFENVKVRRIWHDEQWFYSVVDVVGILTDSEYQAARKYWKVTKIRMIDGGYDESVTKCYQLKLPSADGKKYLTDCANTEGLLRIIQSIPSKKAEPIKLWLAQVGRERLEEIANPELSMHRMQEEYKKRGYDEHWIDVRIRGIVARKELTDQWKDRGASEDKEYSILTNNIAKETFDINVKTHKSLKNLKEKDNLRDHMTPMELILTMLGEETAKEIHKSRDSQGFRELSKDTKEAGKIAKNTRLDIEKKTGKPIVEPASYQKILQQEKEQKKLK
ncbi:phage antirepressor [Alphaproteobacteria bacterium]|nr:phage antirepressor [Alphaproteobacteria bacterium]